MSTVAYRAALVREVEQTMKRVGSLRADNDYEAGWTAGRLDAYAHVLALVSDMEDQ